MNQNIKCKPRTCKPSSSLQLATLLVCLTQAGISARAVISPQPAEAAENITAGAKYTSPYKFKYLQPLNKLLAPDQTPPRNDPRGESSTPYDEWYSPLIKLKHGSWGPEPRVYSPPFPDMNTITDEWKRERIIAVGQKLIGLPYQHHHIPDWEPPADWPKKEVSTAGQSKGLDCSNFTSWLYNYGLGIKLVTNVHKQADEVAIPIKNTANKIKVQTIENPGSYDQIVDKLNTADILYFKNKAGEISHCAVWIGDVGKSPDGGPLLLDCTDMSRKDSNGKTIPVGVNVRPFTQDSWYFKNFSHAHRIIAH